MQLVRKLQRNRAYYTYAHIITEYQNTMYLHMGTFKNSRISDIAVASRRRADIDGEIENIFREPESVSLGKRLDDFVEKHDNDFIHLPLPYLRRVLNLIDARKSMLKASASLAKKFNLSEYPKLPPPDDLTAENLPDDEILKPLTKDEIRRLEEPIVEGL